MIRGLPASLMLHAAVIGAGYLAWPYVGTSVSEQEFVIVPVELVDVGEITNVAPVVEPPEEPPEPEPEEEPEPVLPEEEESEDPVEEEPDPRDVPEDDVSKAAEAAPPEPEDEDVVPDLEQASRPVVVAERKPEPLGVVSFWPHDDFTDSLPGIVPHSPHRWRRPGACAGLETSSITPL